MHSGIITPITLSYTFSVFIYNGDEFHSIKCKKYLIHFLKCILYTGLFILRFKFSTQATLDLLRRNFSPELEDSHEIKHIQWQALFLVNSGHSWYSHWERFCWLCQAWEVMTWLRLEAWQLKFSLSYQLIQPLLPDTLHGSHPTNYWSHVATASLLPQKHHSEHFFFLQIGTLPPLLYFDIFVFKDFKNSIHSGTPVGIKF